MSISNQLASLHGGTSLPSPNQTISTRHEAFILWDFMTALRHSGHVFDIFDFDIFESYCIETIQESSASLATSLVSEWRVSASIDDVPFDPVNPVPHSSCGTPVVRVPTLHAESP